MSRCKRLFYQYYYIIQLKQLIFKTKQLGCNQFLSIYGKMIKRIAEI